MHRRGPPAAADRGRPRGRLPLRGDDRQGDRLTAERPRDPVHAPSEDRVLVVGAAIVDDLDRPTRLLAARRTAPEALAGRWELPGGKVEPGEDPTDALHRELAEELGVRVRVGEQVPGPLADRTWPLTGRYVMAVTLVAIAEGAPRPLEDHDELRWLAAHELRDVPWIEADLPIVDALGELLRG
ncbi:(deoxy)nucleoside triphosphate pyrophosphohydrolase [Janibacter massiliensis]|uniref:(deoxy)nucleoside triphosphate pyrophosphohydrolase n=1 Tax=Janibacter massiliensis TaxID=2058291 RepID=UPI002D79536D|nr:(deoxy)nucleoside triphosphate pyrophosphohydrolase [Janibacter massiliensis]